MTKVATPTSEQTDGQKRNAAYSAAQGRIREKYREEFEKYLAEESEARGVTYTPRVTAEQKALATIQLLLTEYPSLAAKIQAAVA